MNEPMNVDDDFELMAMNELRYLCISKYINAMFLVDRSTFTFNDVTIFVFSVKNANKRDLINYLLYE